MKRVDFISKTASFVMIANASSLVGTTITTSTLGFVFWWVAARLFSADAVGFASASISAMTLLGSMGVFGLGTLPIGELPRHAGKEGELITTAVAMACGIATGFGALFAVIAPRAISDLRPLGADPGSVALFAFGVGLTAATLVLDQALIGLLRGELQLGRNAAFALVKLAVLVVAGLWTTSRLGMTIYMTWMAGNLISTAFIGVFLIKRTNVIGSCRLRLRALQGLGRTALEHHALNIALQAPSQALPVLVTASLSAAMNAYFYIAFMIVGFVFVGSLALTTALYAVSTRGFEALAERVRVTIFLSILFGLAGCGILLLLDGPLLSLFGSGYDRMTGESVRIMMIAVFPLTIRDHYVAVRRIQGRIGSASVAVAAGGLLQLVMAALGAGMGGIAGLCLGWMMAWWIQAGFMAPTVLRAAARCECALPVDPAAVPPVEEVGEGARGR